MKTKTITNRTVRAIREYVYSLPIPNNTFTEVITDRWADKGYDYTEIRLIVSGIVQFIKIND